MKHRIRFIVILSLLAICSGCSINHHVAEGYGKYLTNNKNEQGIPRANVSAQYIKSEKTKAHYYEFRAATVGYANLWIVEFEKILDETLASKEIQSAFNQLSEASDDSNSENLITFSLVDYQYQDYASHITLNIVMTKNGNELINKNYTASGEGQAVQMWAGGVFGMMGPIHDSTKSAMDIILIELVNDINSIELHSKLLTKSQHPDPTNRAT